MVPTSKSLLLLLAGACTSPSSTTTEVDVSSGTTKEVATSGSVTSTETTTSEPLPTTSSTSSTTSTDDTGTSDLPPDLPPCDPYMSTGCPDGHKCAWLNGIDTDFAMLACVPEARQPIQPWQPCPPDLEYTGIDDCVTGTMCLPFGTLDKSWACTPHCEWDGGSEEPYCGPKEVCVMTETWAWCKMLCSPFIQDCPPDQFCVPDGQATTCFSQENGPFSGLIGDPCDSEFGCAPSLICVYAENLQDCAGDACCTPLCSAGDDAVPCPPDLQCTPITVNDHPSFWPGLGICVFELP